MASFISHFEAQLAQGLLDAARIPSYMQNEHTMNIKRDWVQTGGFQLMVPDEVADIAREVLRSRISDADSSRRQVLQASDSTRSTAC